MTMSNLEGRVQTSPKRFLIGASLLMVGLVAFLMTQLLRAPQDPAKVATAALDCTLEGDYECLWEHIPQTERDIYGINREQFIRIMSEYVEPTLGKVKVVSRHTNMRGTGQATAEVEFILDNGQTRRFSVHTAKSPQGVITINLLASLVLGVQFLEAPETPGTNKIQTWLTRVRQDRARLTQLGLKGVYRGPERGFETWDDWTARLEYGAQKMYGK